MDEASASSASSLGFRRYLPIVILVAGVLGGLLFIISVILFCKYCIKRKKSLKRQPAFVKKQSPERSFKPYRKYESLDSFGSQTDDQTNDDEHSVKQDLDEGNSIDYEVARYKESLKGNSEGQDSADDVRTQLLPDPDSTNRSSATPSPAKSIASNKSSDTCSRTGRSRRVSFQLSPTLSTHSHEYNRRRYTVGDFHHFKRHRIEKSPALEKMARQASLGHYMHHDDDRRCEEFYGGSDMALTLSETGSINKDTALYADTSSVMLSPLNEESPSPPTNKMHRTQVSVEVHYEPSNSVNSLEKEPSKSNRASPVVRGAGALQLLEVNYDNMRAKHSHSLEVVSPLDRWSLRDARKAKSYEGELHDYDHLEITQFHRGPFYNADYDVMSEDGSPETRSKVRYNDTGSFEDVNEDHAEMLDEIVIDSLMVDESDDTETLNGTQKYKELWNLRATFEEEEDLSDTIRMEDLTTSPDQSPDREIVTTSYTTSFESNTEPVVCTDESGHFNRITMPHRPATCYLHPNYESRRQNYKNILTKRLQMFNAAGARSADNSFDSIETVDTDGDVSDTSRPEVTTTSFESTTDNTDSTGDSQTHRLQQMRGDSGYKSLETQQPPEKAAQPQQQTQLLQVQPQHQPPKKQIHFALDQDSIEADEPPLSPSPHEQLSAKAIEPLGVRINKNGKSHFERRTIKTASKKRRDYSREKQIVQVYESVCEPVADTQSDHHPGDIFDENALPSKYSVFARFFKSQHKTRMRSQLTRDYSIDEKTDKLFHDFVRQDPEYDLSKSMFRTRRSPRMHRSRLIRKHTDPCPPTQDHERRRDKLAPETRSVSLGSDSSTSSVRLLSPQDSIEEEYVRAERTRRGHWDSYRHFDRLPHYTSTIHEIPIFRLPEEDVSDMRD